jgi:hypothetical protein
MNGIKVLAEVEQAVAEELVTREYQRCTLEDLKIQREENVLRRDSDQRIG